MAISKNVRDDYHKLKEEFGKEQHGWYKRLNRASRIWRDHLRDEGVQTPQGQNAAQRPKYDSSLKPEPLGKNHTPAEFKTWLRDFKTYFNANKFELDTREVQRGNLHRCIDKHFR